MSLEVEKVSDLKSIVHISIEPNDYLDAVEVELKKLKKKGNFPGFRPGHVPMSHLKRLYGKSVIADQVEKALQQEFRDLFKESKLLILGQPTPLETNKSLDSYALDFNDTFHFDFDLNLHSDFNLLDYSKHTLTKYVCEISDKELDEEIEKLKEQLGEYNETETVNKETTLQIKVKVKRKEITPEQKEEEGEFFETTIIINPKYSDNTKFLEKLKPLAKKEDSINLNLISLFKDKKEDLGNLLKLKVEELDNLEDDFTLTLFKTYEWKTAEMNEEFFKKVFGEQEKIEDEAKFRDKLKEAFSKSNNVSSQNLLVNSIRKHLVSKIDISFPEGYVLDLIKNNKTQELPEDDKKKEKDLINQYTEELKLNLISNKVYEEEKLNVEQEEVFEYEVYSLADQYRQMYNQNIDPETLKKIASERLMKEEHFYNTFEAVKKKKVFETLLTKFSTEDKKVSKKKFEELIKESYS